MVAPSRRCMNKRRHTTRSTAISFTGRATEPAAFWAIAAPGVAGTAITGTDTVGAVGGMAATVHGTEDMEADTEVEDMAAEAGMVAAKTCPSSHPT